MRYLAEGGFKIAPAGDRRARGSDGEPLPPGLLAHPADHPCCIFRLAELAVQSALEFAQHPGSASREGYDCGNREMCVLSDERCQSIKTAEIAQVAFAR